MKSHTELVFVYGTLRRGASNHWRMDSAEWAGPAVVAGHLFRVDWYPGLVLDEAGGKVVGELYRVTPDLLEKLDEFEGITGGPSDEYRRVRAMVRRKGEGGEVEAWAWEWRQPFDSYEPVVEGDWLEWEHPRRGPLFLGIALLPVLFVVLSLLFPRFVELFPDPSLALLPWVLGGAPVVMATAAGLSLGRRERGHGLGWMVLYVGVMGTVIALVTTGMRLLR